MAAALGPAPPPRARAVEELQRVLEALSQAAVASAPGPALLGLLGLLCALLDDANFAVVLGALEAGLGDPRAALRRRCHVVLRRLMEAAGPRRVLGLLLRREHLLHRNARVREEVVAACIAALLVYPSRELDLDRLAFGLAPALVDGKRRVRHAALEAFALLASLMGPGKSGLLFEAVDAVELEDDGDGVMHAVQARLARKSLPRLGENGSVEYAVPLPSCGQGCGAPRGADTEWLLKGSRTQSAHSCGSHHGDAARSSGSPGATTRRVLSAGKNKLPWEGERGGDGEGGMGDVVPLAKDVEQFPSSGDFLHSPRLQPCQGMPGSDEFFFSRRRPSRNLFQNSVDFNSEHPSLDAGAVGSHQPHLSGKCGTLGYTQTRGKSGSVDSALQFLGLNNCQQDKVCASLNFSSKTQRSVCSPVEQTSCSQGSNVSQGALILPSYPLASPGSSPSQLSSPADSPKKSRDSTMSFSNSWPLKSFEGLHKPSSQKPRTDSAGDNLEKHCALQLKPTLVRHPASRRGLAGSRPVPPIPRLASPLPSRAQGRAEQCEHTWMSEVSRKLAADVSELSVDDEEVDQEEMQSSLRSLRNSAAKKRAKLSSNFTELDSPDSTVKLDVSAESSSHASSPSSCSESGAYSQESLTSPVSTAPQRRRVMSDTFPLLGNKAQPARIPAVRSGDANVAERNSSKVSLCSLQQLSHPRSISPNGTEDAVVIVGKGVFGSLPSAQTQSQTETCVGNGDNQCVQELSPGLCRRNVQHSGASPFHDENEREIKVTMSKSAQDKMRQKKKERKEQSRKEYQEGKCLEEKGRSPWERLNLNEVENATTDSEH
ncbi:hypothetical protein ASZ78_014384 [Callipepla squamata]|uniref:TOG domain-containing protein n=1 Tax=Callipepla squamata TaxID=9009 RepID=A0A226MP42_CALSU|nr:hypothetical protein ASZ78_014384 [Callipepla squamata]